MNESKVGVCEVCDRPSLDLQLVSDGSDSGESDWMCVDCRRRNYRLARNPDGCKLCGGVTHPRRVDMRFELYCLDCGQVVESRTLEPRDLGMSHWPC